MVVATNHRKQRLILSLALASGIVLAACARHITPTIPVSPFEQAMVNNAQLATINNAVAHGVQAAVQSGLVPAQAGAQIIGVCKQIAVIDEQITLILEKVPDNVKVNAVAIQQLVKQIQAAVKTLVGNGALGIKNPQTQSTVQAEVDAVASLADLVLTQLRQAGVL